MALANLEKDLESIITAIRRPEGGDTSDDPLRGLFDKVPAIFELEKSQMVKELKLVQRRAPETGKYGGALYGEFTQKGDTKRLEEFASAWIAEFKKQVSKKSTKLEIIFDIDTPTHLKVAAVFKPKTTEANIYNFFRERQKQTRQALTATGNYENVLTRASKSNKGEEIFNVGHHVSVAEARLSVFTSMAVRAAQDSGAFDHLEDKGKKLIVSTVKKSLDKLDLKVEITDDVQIFIDKDGALEGSMEVKYDAESWFKNQILRQEEAEFGAALTNPNEKNSIINLLNKAFQKEAEKRLVGESGKAYTKRKGSLTLEQNALAIIINNPFMRKMYAKKLAKNLSNIKFEPKGKSHRKSLPLKIKGKRVSYKVKGGNKITPPVPKKTKNIESNQNALTQKAFQVRAFVNSRLTKTLKGNMGRPSLENRTGRFAQSAEVVNANALGNHIHMDYTYNPLYRVFEDGAYYPSGYDPRPLIEKSIRELAAAQIETRFTLRRI